MSQRPVGYLQLLRHNSEFTRLWLGQLVSNLGDWFNTVAVLALVYDLTGSGLATGLIIIASTLPAFILTPFAGVVVDRFDRRRIMMAADLTRAVLALGMLLVRSVDQIALLYVFSALLISFSSFFGPALSAAIPNLVDPDELISANALSSSTWGLMLAVGAAVGGVVIATLGHDAAFVVNSLSFVFSAVMIFSIRKPFGLRQAPRANASHPLIETWQDFRSSLSFLRAQPQVTASVLVKTGIGLAGGIILLLTVFAQSVFRAGDGGIGWLYSARGLGVLLGPYLARPIVGYDLSKMRRVILVAFVLAGVGYLGFSGAPLFWIGALLVVVGHVGTGILWVLSSTMLQLLVPDHLRGRIFAIDFGSNTVTSALSTFLVGLLLEKWDARVVAAAMGVVFIVYAFVWGGAVIVSQRRHAAAWKDQAPSAAPSTSE
ncbi:MAG: MFS transporter [Chloroflexota bacterium]|nr:MFS transporter [Chloroflexota bacterium]